MYFPCGCDTKLKIVNTAQDILKVVSFAYNKFNFNTHSVNRIWFKKIGVELCLYFPCGCGTKLKIVNTAQDSLKVISFAYNKFNFNTHLFNRFWFKKIGVELCLYFPCGCGKKLKIVNTA